MYDALLLATLALGPSSTSLAAPELDGGSVVRVSEGGALEVRDADTDRLRWRVGLGAPARQLAFDTRRVYVATGRHLRAFAGGISRWALDLGAPATALELHPGGRLRVGLPRGTMWVDARRGRFCTPRQPCSGLGAWSLGSIGVPFLDLPGLGVPGLGLLVNPALLESGDLLGAYVAPGPLPGFVPLPPPPPAAPRARSVAAGAPRVWVERGPSGKVRGFSSGGGLDPAWADAPEIAPAE